MRTATSWPPTRPRLRSFDHLVRADREGLRNRQSERPGRSEVDEELELGWLLEGQLAGLGALQDLVDVVRRPADDGVEVGSVAQQRAALGPRSPARHEKDAMSGCHVDDLLP